VAGKPTPIKAQDPDAESLEKARRIGVLAIQGDFEAHARALERLGCEPVEVRRAEQLTGLDALIIPGGESTTMQKGVAEYRLEQPLRQFVQAGGPVLGTCAGLILLDRRHLGLMDIEARRNAFGRQVKSFEADLSIRGLGDEPLRAVFIRAPWIEWWGPGVELLAEIDGHPIVARQRNMLVAAFHPELTDDLRLHALFLGIGGHGLGGRSEEEGTGTGRRRLLIAGRLQAADLKRHG
jgi:5'-phosphate synthase pdxT subunit